MNLLISDRTRRQLSKLFGIKGTRKPTNADGYWQEFVGLGTGKLFHRLDLSFAYCLWLISNNLVECPKLDIDLQELIRNLKVADRLSYLRDYLKEAVPGKYRRYTRIHCKPRFSIDQITGCPLLESVSITVVIRVKDIKFIFPNSRKLFSTREVPYTIRHNLYKRNLTDLINQDTSIEVDYSIRFAACTHYIVLRLDHDFGDVLLCCHEKLAHNAVTLHLNKMRSW